MKVYLLDTNVISELMTNAPNATVIHFLAHLTDSYLSVITLHELRYGLSLLPEGQRRKAITSKLEILLAGYNDHIIPVTQAEALHAAELRASAKQQGRVVHLADALIASTAKVHNLIVATRNTSDFIDLGVDIIDPWTI
ncbi:MAG: type II toxin-antitoxin system VapC family toxin [Methylobacter sp.]|nr:type II toxin-antitoxin system VapC family toxin [Methylobacter sp.]